MPLGEAIRGRQADFVSEIKSGMKKGKTEEEIENYLHISVSYVQKLKKRHGLTNQGSKIWLWGEKDPYISSWLKQDRKESTKYQYLVSVKNYCDFRGKTPKKLLHDVFMENRRIKDNIKKSKDNIKRFERTLLEEGMSDATVKTYMAGINSFFKYGLSEIKKYFIEVLEENGIQYEKNSQFEALKELGYKGTARGPGRFALIKNDGSLEEIIRHSNDYRNIFVKEENGLFKELKHRGKTYKKVLRVLRGLDNTHEIRMRIIKKQSIEDKFLEYYSS